MCMCGPGRFCFEPADCSSCSSSISIRAWPVSSRSCLHLFCIASFVGLGQSFWDGFRVVVGRGPDQVVGRFRGSSRGNYVCPMLRDTPSALLFSCVCLNELEPLCFGWRGKLAVKGTCCCLWQMFCFLCWLGPISVVSWRTAIGLTNCN